jgi:hypothetical protein
VFNALRVVDAELVDSLQRPKFFFLADIHDDKIDGAVLTLADLNLRIKVFDFFWLR